MQGIRTDCLLRTAIHEGLHWMAVDFYGYAAFTPGSTPI